MRYGGKKMKADWWIDEDYCYVVDGELWKVEGNKTFDRLLNDDIMGSWVEVK